jgi:hypothetical protein
VTLEDAVLADSAGVVTVDTLALHDALERLAAPRPRAAEVVELRYWFANGCATACCCV